MNEYTVKILWIEYVPGARCEMKTVKEYTKKVFNEK